MGSVQKRGKSWYIVYEAPRAADGKRRQVWRKVDGTKRDAEKALSVAEANVRAGGMPAAARMTVEEVLSRWLASVERQVAPATQRSYARQVARLTEEFGALRIESLSALHIESWLAGPAWERKRGEGKLSARAVQLALRVLSMALDQAVGWRLIMFNPARAVKGPVYRRPDARVLSAEEAAELLGSLRGEWLYLPTLLALTAGLREGEVCALKWTDLDLEAGTLTVRASVDSSGPGLVDRPPKTRTVAPIGLPAPVAVELRLAKAVSNSERVVCEPDGRTTDPEYLCRRFTRRARALAVDLTFHGLRHTHATLLLSAGVHPRVAMERMRHSTMAMMSHYSHVLPALRSDAAQKVGRALFGPSEE